MRQEHFEAANTHLWQRYDEIAGEIKKRSSNRGPVDAEGFPALYRKICNHYALALSRQYSPALVNRLHARVLSGHQIIYKQAVFNPSKIINFFSLTFPSTLRNNIAYFSAALLLFLIPFIGTGMSCYFKHDLIYSIMDTSRVAEMEFMYDPANHEYGRPADRQQNTGIAMLGYYIRNNISIGFRTFAAGILAGTGTVFFLAANGIFLGAVAGHITRLGFTSTFWPFVSSHGAFELTAIVISGAAGLILARAVIAPGNRYRSDALRRDAITALRLILGAAAMLVLAAFIEAFWSPAETPAVVKYLGAGLLWTLVITYLGFAGKGRKNTRNKGVMSSVSFEKP
ncbi:MAG: stage II sporulation protein M [Desulfobacterales bacterium]